MGCDVEISGTPCVDDSLRGRREGVHGENAKVMLVWVKLLLADNVKVAIHENTQSFPIEIMAELLKDKYDHIPFGQHISWTVGCWMSKQAAPC